MSDDLVKRLREIGDHASFEPHMHHTAADRIEKLEERLKAAQDDAKEAEAYAGELEAKLAWAMEGLPQMKSDLENSDYNSAYHVCKHILEQLTGGKDE